MDTCMPGPSGMGATETEWWMGERTTGLHEIDDHLRSLDTLASPQSFGMAAYPQLARVDDDYAEGRRAARRPWCACYHGGACVSERKSATTQGARRKNRNR